MSIFEIDMTKMVTFKKEVKLVNLVHQKAASNSTVKSFEIVQIASL
jgi:hypothetical protein